MCEGASAQLTELSNRAVTANQDGALSVTTLKKKEKSEEKMADITKDDVIEFIANMSVLELSELVKELEEKFGVSAAAAMPVMAAGGAAAPEEETVEQTEFDVILNTFGDKKIQVIKEVRAITGLGLKDAKTLVDNVPSPIKEGIAKEDAEKIKAQLEEVGAQVELK